ncbi:MAG TPA: nucleotide-binding protein [Prolixibacteraceae bacterium]|nr:nucleotide-binding protein [Prolixibacteraceae bacterium]
MGKSYLLDTNAILDFMGDKLPAKARAIFSQIVDDQINISVINKIEILCFSFVEQDLIDFVNYSNVFPLDDHIVTKTIEIRRLYKKIKLPDAIIASTALHYDLILITNDKDFENINGLKVESPYDLDDVSTENDSQDFEDLLNTLA